MRQDGQVSKALCCAKSNPKEFQQCFHLYKILEWAKLTYSDRKQICLGLGVNKWREKWIDSKVP